MKKIFASLFIIILLAQDSYSQNNLIREKAIGVSFILNDFITANRIRNGSVEQVIREDKWAKFSEMAPGLAVTYFNGIHKNVDFAGTIGFSFADYPFPKKPSSSEESLLIEADASVNLKMFSDAYWVTPYLSAGLGASKYRNYYGAFIPLGIGLKINFLDEAALFVNSSYRVPVTAETANYHLIYSFGISGIIGNRN
jgi:OmpA-OmpF porin, OOP family